MVKWHVNDRERPRGTHLGLVQWLESKAAKILKVNLGEDCVTFFQCEKKSFFTEIQNEKWKRGNKIGKGKGRHWTKPALANILLELATCLT